MVPSSLAAIYRSQNNTSFRRILFHPFRGDMLVLGSDRDVEVVLVRLDPNSQVENWQTHQLISWNLSAEITAIDITPTSDCESIELVAATTSPSLFRLEWNRSQGSRITQVGQGMITKLIYEARYATVRSSTSCRAEMNHVQNNSTTQLVATVGDQGVLMLWDFSQQQPTLTKVIPHPFPLRSLSFHPTNPSLIMTGDTRGMLRLIDIDLSKPVLSLFEPRSLARSIRGDLISLDWNQAAVNPPDELSTTKLGAVIDGRWALWDLRKIDHRECNGTGVGVGGGGPVAFGSAFSEQLAGRTVFRWHPRDPKIFAVLCSNPNASPALTFYNTSFPQNPKPIDIATRPLQAFDMAFSPTDEILAVIVDRQVIFVSLGSNAF